VKLGSQAYLDYRDPEWVAERLGIDKNTVYRHLQDGVIPGLQLGRKWLISEQRLAEFLGREERQQTEKRQKGSRWWTKLGRLADRFTERTCQVLEEARLAAHRLRHDKLGEVHLLLGFAAVPDCLAMRALEAGGIGADALRAAAESKGPAGVSRPGAALGVTPRLRQAIGRGFDEARRARHGYVGTEHLLLGMLALEEGLGYDVLRSLGAGRDAMQAQVAKLLSAPE